MKPEVIVNNEQNITYYIDSEKKTVVCKKTGCKDIAINHLIDCGIGFMNYFMQINDSYVGKATCHPDDVFDVKKGMRIAKLRMMKKLNKDIMKKLENANFVLHISLDKLSKKCKSRRDVINSVVSEEISLIK